MEMEEKIVIVGLGYVGLPLALLIAKDFSGTIGFDKNSSKIHCLKEGTDSSNQIQTSDIKSSSILFTDSTEKCKDGTFFIVVVQTPVDKQNFPNLDPLRKVSETIGSILRPKSIVVYESTVYPGVTECVCRPILEETSGLKAGIDFKVGYSPERVMIGNEEMSLTKMVKVVSAEDEEALNRIDNVYSKIIPAGTYRAPSIKVAEAAKVIENVQRDVNFALINEFAMIFNKLKIRTADVLETAKTRSNFLPFTPGLVGGHCVAVDPYYLMAKAEETGSYAALTSTARKLNNSVSPFLADQLIKLLVKHCDHPKNAKVGIFGISFRENISDSRNSQVPKIVNALAEAGIRSLVHDPLAIAEDVEREYGMTLAKWEEVQALDALVLAVTHKEFVDIPIREFLKCLKLGGIIMDVKSALNPKKIPEEFIYWSL